MGITEVAVSGRLALACERCGELIVFLGREQDWYKKDDDGQPRSFPCGGCGTRLFLIDRMLVQRNGDRTSS